MAISLDHIPIIYYYIKKPPTYLNALTTVICFSCRSIIQAGPIGTTVLSSSQHHLGSTAEDVRSLFRLTHVYGWHAGADSHLQTQQESQCAGCFSMLWHGAWAPGAGILRERK